MGSIKLVLLEIEVASNLMSKYVQCILINPPQFVFEEYGGLTGYSLVLVHYIGTEKLWQIKGFGG